MFKIPSMLKVVVTLYFSQTRYVLKQYSKLCFQLNLCLPVINICIITKQISCVESSKILMEYFVPVP